MVRNHSTEETTNKEVQQSKDDLLPLAGGGAAMLTVFLLSGASGLIYQVVWSRALTLVFGSTSQGVATVLAAFMGGLAIGSAVASRIGDKVKSPLKAYALLEGGIAFLALSVLFLMPVLEIAYRAIYPLAHLSLTGLTLVRFLLACAFLLPTTILMGATLPILSAYFERHGKVEGQGASILYTINTTGAVAGTALAGFFLLPTLGMTGTTVIAVATNAVAALGALWLSRQVESGEKSPGRFIRIPFSEPRVSAITPKIPEPERPAPISRAAVAAAIGISGLGALVLEVVWTRSLALILGSSTYAFTIMLTTFLIGLALGSAVASKLLHRVRNPMMVFAVVELATGVAVYAGVVLLPELPYMFLELFRSTAGSPGLFSAGRFLMAGSIMLPPTLLLGATFPLAVRCLRVGARAAAAPVGFLYSVNTMGAIAGSLAAGFLLIPGLGLKQTLIIGALINLSAGAFLIVMAPGRRPVFKFAAAGLTALLMPGLIVGAPDWNPMVMASGVYQYAPRYVETFKNRQEFLDHHDAGRILYYKDGRSATVSVEVRPRVDDLSRHLALAVNGKVDASNHADMETQVLLAHIPMLLAAHPEKVALVGWGSGITAGSALTHGSLKTMTAIEIEPAVLEASRFFTEFNNQPEEDPRLTIELNDARHLLLVADGEFDLIISEPSNPWLPGPSRLFTREAFVMMKDRLTEGGMLCQWVQLYGLDEATFKTLLRTISDVFEDVVVIKASAGDALVLASDELIRINAGRVVQLMNQPGVKADLARIKIATLAQLLARFRVGGSGLDAIIGDGPINTDDNALIEFSAAQTIHILNEFTNEVLLAKPLWSPLDRTDLSGLPEHMSRRIALDLARELFTARLNHRAQSILKTFSQESGIDQSLVAEAQALQGEMLGESGDRSGAVQSWRDALERDPSSTLALFDLGKHFLNESRDPEAAERLLRKAVLSNKDFAEGKLELARALYDLDRHREAIEILTAAAEGNPPRAIEPAIHAQWGRSCFALDENECAINQLTRYFREWPDIPKPAEKSMRAAIDLGGAYLATAQTPRALEQFQIAGNLGRTLSSWNKDQAQLAENRGNLKKMEEHLKEAIRWSPGDAMLYRNLGGRYMQTKKWSDALPIWQELLIRHPGDKYGLRGATQALSYLGRLGESAPYLKKLIDFENDPAELSRLQAAYQQALATQALP
jgi:spermidine synthase